MQKDADNLLQPSLLQREVAPDQAGENALGSDMNRTSVGSDGRSNLSRALVHDLRNAVGPIRNAVHLLRFRCRDDPNLGQITDIIDRQVSAIVQLLNGPDAAPRTGQGDVKSTADVPAAQGHSYDPRNGR